MELEEGKRRKGIFACARIVVPQPGSLRSVCPALNTVLFLDWLAPCRFLPPEELLGARERVWGDRKMVQRRRLGRLRGRELRGFPERHVLEAEGRRGGAFETHPASTRWVLRKGPSTAGSSGQRSVHVVEYCLRHFYRSGQLCEMGRYVGWPRKESEGHRGRGYSGGVMGRGFGTGGFRERSEGESGSC